jgi:hypothetical protein
MLRTAFLTAALILAGNVANAQITTYVGSPRVTPPTPEAVALADSAKRDSVEHTAMTNMKEWVDSASGVPVPSTVGKVDSAALINDAGRPVVTTFSNGSVAPATASNLPTLAIIGVVALALGLVVLERQSRA